MRARIAAMCILGAMAISFSLVASDIPGSENERVVLAMTEAINNRQLDLLDSVVSSDIHRRSGATPGLIIENLDQFRTFLRSDFASVPDSHQEVTHIFSSGNLVAVRAIYSGTQSGPWGPFQASNKRLEIPFIGILRVEDGKVEEIWVEWDNFNALLQLGHIELPAAAVPDK